MPWPASEESLYCSCISRDLVLSMQMPNGGRSSIRIKLTVSGGDTATIRPLDPNFVEHGYILNLALPGILKVRVRLTMFLGALWRYRFLRRYWFLGDTVDEPPQNHLLS